MEFAYNRAKRRFDMRQSFTIIVVTLVLVFCQTGCSWIWWQRVPAKECRLGPPIIDTVTTVGSVIGAGILLSAAANYHCDSSENDLCGFGVLAPAITGGGLALVALIYGAASITGWVRYNKCEEY
jgi:hypothetical protein